MTDGSRPPRDGSGGDNTCERLSVETQEDFPAVLIVLDRSGSMYSPQEDRWTPAVNAINSLVGTFEDRFQFGLVLYPDQTNNESQQCNTTSAQSVRVIPDIRMADEIATALSGSADAVTGGGTPTYNALLYARNVLNLDYFDGKRKYVVLITDGAPNCNGALNPNSCTCTVQTCQAGWQCLDDQRTIGGVQSLATDGVQTYVIGYYVDQATGDTLREMAVAGGTGETDFIEVSNGAVLEDKLREIAGQAASCSFQLQGEAPNDPKFVRVSVTSDDTEMWEIDHVDASRETAVQGWRFEGNTIEVQGPACERLKNGQRHDVEIVVECVPVVI